MSEQLVDIAVVIGFVGGSSSFVSMCDGVHTIQAYVPKGVTVQVGQAFTVHKQGTTYYVGAEVSI